MRDWYLQYIPLTKEGQNMFDNLPKIGARTLKTGIAIFLCTLIPPLLFKRTDTLIASVSAIMCIQNSIESSMNTGKHRILGTIIGALTGFVFTYAATLFNNSTMLSSLLAAIGVIITIYLCTAFSIQSSITIACVVFLCIFISVGEEQWFAYSINRVVDTFIGVTIGLIVNKYLFRESFKKAGKEDN